MKRTRVSLAFAFFSRCSSIVRRIGFPGLAVAVALSSLQLASSAAFAQQQRGFPQTAKSAQAAVRNGKYYALVIGINQYHSALPQLKTAVNDANAVAQLLQEQYGFQVTKLLDKEATRAKILDTISAYKNTLNEEDNLLIYYGGHGSHDKDADKTYWLPVDAESSTSSNAIMEDDLTSKIKALPARHVLIIADSCYSGDLSRDAADVPPVTPTQPYLNRMLKAKSRTIMASGGDAPVSDSGADGHSIFAYAFLKAMKGEEDPVFSADEVFYSSVRKHVQRNAEQDPKYSHLHNSGDDDGDFVFVRKGAQINAAASSGPAGTLTRSATTETASAEPAPAEPAPAPAADIPNSNMTPVPSGATSAGTGSGGSGSAREAFDRGLADLKSGQFAEAFQLLTLACNGGVSRGCGNLGVMYQKGNGVNQDLGQAAVLFRKGCSGDAWGACFLLGVMYESGNGVPRDQSQAIPLYLRSCEGGDGRGCTNLGVAYNTGNGVPQNQAQASSLFHKACDTGVPRGCALLGLAYHEGAGLPKDDSQAALFARKACDGADPMGCNMLGVGYEFGYGVPRDKRQAVALYRQACTAGFDAACKNLNRVQR
jgi:TPR repeat protein